MKTRREEILWEKGFHKRIRVPLPTSEDFSNRYEIGDSLRARCLNQTDGVASPTERRESSKGPNPAKPGNLLINLRGRNLFPNTTSLTRRHRGEWERWVGGTYGQSFNQHSLQ